MAGKGINGRVTTNYDGNLLFRAPTVCRKGSDPAGIPGREFGDGPNAVLCAPPKEIKRTSLYTLESKNISAYGGLVEMGGSNMNLFDRQTYREVVTRKALEIRIIKILDLLAPKNPETGIREVRSDP